MDAARKKEIYSLACAHDLVILEDDPYYHLNFAGPSAPVPCVPSVCAVCVWGGCVCVWAYVGVPRCSRNVVNSACATLSHVWYIPALLALTACVAAPKSSMLSMDDQGRVIRFDSMSKVLLMLIFDGGRGGAYFVFPERLCPCHQSRFVPFCSAQPQVFPLFPFLVSCLPCLCDRCSRRGRGSGGSPDRPISSPTCSCTCSPPRSIRRASPRFACRCHHHFARRAISPCVDREWVGDSEVGCPIAFAGGRG